jgi:hypothetical protein
LSARTYIGAVIFFVILGLFAAAYLTAEHVEAADLIPESSSFIASVSMGALAGYPSGDALEFFEADGFDHVGLLQDTVSVAHIAGWEPCDEGGQCAIIILEVDDRKAFEAALAEEYPGESTREYRGVKIFEIHEPHEYYWAGDICVIGEDSFIERSIDAYKGVSARVSGNDTYLSMSDEVAAYPICIYAPGMPGESGEAEELFGLGGDFGGFDAMAIGINPDTGAMKLVLDFASAQDAVAMKMMLSLLLSQDEAAAADEMGLDIDLDGDMMRIMLVLPDDLGLDELGLLGGDFGIPI